MKCEIIDQCQWMYISGEGILFGSTASRYLIRVARGFSKFKKSKIEQGRQQYKHEPQKVAARE